MLTTESIDRAKIAACSAYTFLRARLGVNSKKYFYNRRMGTEEEEESIRRISLR